MSSGRTRQNKNATISSIANPAADEQRTRSPAAASSMRSKDVIGGMGDLFGKQATGEIESARGPEKIEINEAGVKDLKGKLSSTVELIKAIEQLGLLATPARQELEALALSYKSPSGTTERDLHRVTEEKKRLAQENQNLTKTMENMELALKSQSEEKNQIKKLQADLQKANDASERRRQNYENAMQLLKKEEEVKTELQLSVNHGKEDLKTLGIEVDHLTKQLTKSDEKVKQLTRDKLQAEKDLSECKSRLSRLMGNNLSDNNPDIADLSDSNRPTKIAEKYQELYDNQWTDAYEVIENKYPDQEQNCIGILLEILKTTKDFCVKLSEEQSAEIQRIVKLSENKLTRSEQLPDLVKKQVKDFRKSVAEVCLSNVYERFLTEQRRSTHTTRMSCITNPTIRPFVKECVELCWLMTVQDPPVVIGDSTKYNGKFDTNVFKAYTQTGDRLSYVVWPPLYLHENGPLLGKGIAQATGISARGRRRQGQNQDPGASTHETAVVQKDPINQDIDRGSSQNDTSQVTTNENTYANAANVQRNLKQSTPGENEWGPFFPTGGKVTMSSSVRQPSSVQSPPSYNQRGFAQSTRSPSQGVGRGQQQFQQSRQPGNVVLTHPYTPTSLDIQRFKHLLGMHGEEYTSNALGKFKYEACYAYVYGQSNF